MTVVGAAVVSVLATVGSAVYGHGIRKTGAKLQETPAARLTRPLSRWKQRDSDEAAPEPDHPAPGWRQWVSQRRWGLAAGVAIVFVASLATVTLVELVSQRPLARISGSEPSGNTSIGSLFDGGGQETPDDGTTTTTDPSGTSTSTDSSDSSEPSEEPEPSTSTTSDGTASTSPTTEG